MTANAGVMIPPLGACAICQRPIGVYRDHCRITFEVMRTGKLEGNTYELLACGSAHAAEAMERFAMVVRDKLNPAEGSTEFAQRHGVLIKETTTH